MRRLVLTITALALALPATAAAESYDVAGGGFGHGVGMSQYGAYGLAQQGQGYEGILAHYYSGTELGPVGRARVRVLLQASRPERASFKNAKRAGGQRLDPRETYTVRVNRRSKLVVRSSDRQRVGGFAPPLRIKGRGDRLKLGGEALNSVTDGRYRGKLELRPGTSGGITAINDVELEDYVRSVVPAEMPASWHLEALKAQAVAARSYALAVKAGGELFDHYPDVRSQVYRGIAAELPATDQATADTARQVVIHEGKVAKTFFYSSSGGHTEDVEKVFGGSALPYLRGVEDPYDDLSPRHRWTFRFTKSEMEQRLGSLVQGGFEGITVLETGTSPRIMRATVHGSEGSTEVRGVTLQRQLGTYDIPSSVDLVPDS